ncbi:hypothetical protein A2V71_01400 [Candidatus Berkelbacteria bacterium RBG_13_40_8]|uniref:Uncharacterized protein n=1 Tax=Candidatus Berkelbacteria bacterium RBG_13_40_8 TaxID=1797467 RepID=A0A1F5DMI2_9BACT|nr:MAG: hypothetical protein A2V71_01400 [Candidatus Berkelbacteria bacterium RBG_13_40_8]
MKPALFLIFIFVLLFLFQINFDKVFAQEQKVSVSATVDEHLTYFKNGDDLVISTNSRAQYLILSPTGDLIGQVSGPTELKTIHLQDKYFILIAQL